MRRAATHAAPLSQADPATVERSGFAIGHFAGFQRAAWGSLVKFGGMSEKPLRGIAMSQQDASSSTNRPPFAMPQTPGRRASPFGLLPHRFRAEPVRRTCGHEVVTP